MRLDHSIKTSRRPNASRVAEMLRCGLAIGALAVVIHQDAMAQTAATARRTEARAGALNDEILVTARRRDEALMDVPVAVTAFSQTALNQRAIASAYDLNKAVPGLTVQAINGSTAVPAFAIRGRGQNFGAASGSVETYFAEVPLSPPFGEPTLPVQFFDLASFQVLKGPQGTLFGRNTTGGAVLVVPAAPSDQFEGYARAQVGTFTNRQFEAAVNIPIAGEKAALRLAGFHWKRDGYVRTLAGSPDGLTGLPLPAQDFQNQNTTEFRATLRLRPTERFENSTIFSYHYDKVRTSMSPGLNIGDASFLPFGTLVAIEPLSGFPVYQSPLFGARTARSNVNLNKPGNHAWAVINTTSFAVSDSLTIKNIFGYVEARGYTLAAQDYDGTDSGIYEIFLPPRRNINRQYTNELQLQGKSLDGRFNWTVGGLIDLTREPGGTRMNYQDFSQSFGQFVTVFEQNRFTSKSLYASGSFAITDQLNLSAGYRHTWDNIKLVSQTVIGFTPQDGFVENADPALATSGSRKFQGDTYNAGLDWKPRPGLLVYASYRHGYKRGGFNLNSAGGFEPEKVDNFNLGLKHEFALGEMKGRFSIEGFYDFYKKQQVSYVSFDPTLGFIAITDNAPKTVFRGFEAEAALDPVPWLNLTGAFSYIDAKNKRWIDTTAPSATPQDLSGNPVPNVSKYKLSGTARLHTELAGGGEIAIAPSINYQSRFITYPFARSLPLATQQALGFNFDQLAVGAAQVRGYTTVDVRAEWNQIQGTNFSVAANVTNLTNKNYLLHATGTLFASAAAVVQGPPRMFTVEAKYKF